VDGPLTYRKWLDSVRDGRSYVSDGKTHLMDFAVNGTPAGTAASEVKLSAPGRVKVAVTAAANLDVHPNDALRQLRYDEKPYWDIERARIGSSREVPVEVIVNGQRAAVQNLVADGRIRTLSFDVAVERSSWIAVRVLPSAHTNPVFVVVGGQPVRASKRSAQWCLDAVNQCWTQKAAQIRAAERDAARAAYDHAREVYKARIGESDR